MNIEICLDLWLTAHGARLASYHSALDYSASILDFAKSLGMTWAVLANDEETLFTCDPEVLDFVQSECNTSHWNPEALASVLEYTFGKRDFPSRIRDYAVVNIWADVKRNDGTATFLLFNYIAEADTIDLYESEKKRVERWERILSEHPFPFAKEIHLRLSIDYEQGAAERLKRAHDWTYVQTHYKQYFFDLWLASDSDSTRCEIARGPCTEEEWNGRLREKWISIFSLLQ